MHALHDSAPPPDQNSLLGSIEAKAGSLVGCEGMVDEGAQRQTGTSAASVASDVTAPTPAGFGSAEGRGLGGEETKKLV